jgi:hypothetical protein
MTILQISKIINKTGNYSELPQLDSGELGWATDQKRLFIGNADSGNTEIVTANSISPGLVPIASTSALGSVKIGTGLSIDEFGVLSNIVSEYPLSIKNGGTGATTEATARTNLGAVNIAGDTMTGYLKLNADPTQGLHAATKQYVDNLANGLSIGVSARAGTTGPLTATYSNGTNGVGATLTGTTSLPVISGVTLRFGDRVLVKNQTDAKQNGMYEVTTTSPYVLTRTDDYNDSINIKAGDAFFIGEGELESTQWVMNTSGVITVGTSNIVFTQFGGPNMFSAGAGISIDGKTINNTGVTSLIGGTNISVSGSTGAVTVSLNGILPIQNGGTNANDKKTALNNLLPTQAGNINKVLHTDGADASWKFVSFANLVDKPTTLAGYGITDTVSTTAYVDRTDYLNFSPYAGYLKDNYIPVYGSFSFSLGRFAASSFMFVDREGKQVIYFPTSSPTNTANVARAFRYTSNDKFVYDNQFISASFLNSNEKVRDILNLGTFFVVLVLSTTVKPETNTRVVIAKTNGSSNWTDWSLAADVTSLYDGRTNFSLVSTNSGDRILASSVSSDQNQVTLRVYDINKTLLRSQLLYDKTTMVNTADTLGSGRIAPSTMPLLNYAPNGVHGFTWNPFTQTFHQKFTVWYIYTQNGASVGVNTSMDISWSVPKSWIETGTGTPSNLIPVKSGTFRYNQLADSTWETDDGGMSQNGGGAGFAVNFTTDEYSGNIFQVLRGTWDSAITATVFLLSYSNGYIYKTFGSNNSSKYTTFSEYIPDGSAWSKSLYSNLVHVIDNNIIFVGQSVKDGSKTIQTTFSKTAFTSTAQGQTNDTLILDAANASLDPASAAPTFIKNNFYSSAFGTVVVGTTPTYYWVMPGQTIHTITANQNTRTYTATSITLPVIPSNLGGKTGVFWDRVSAWNGSTSSPIVYAVVRDAAGLAYIARYSGSSWQLATSNVLQTQIDSGKTGRGDANNIISFDGTTLLTNNGRLLINFSIPVTGGSAWYWASFNTNSNLAETVGDLTRFAPQSTGAGSFTQPNGYPGSSFGFSTAIGYYRAISSSNYDNIALVSSRDVRGVGSELTEDQWFNATTTRYQVYISAESSTGLVAYITECPLFIGGYYTTVPTQSVNLIASATNYVYITKNAGDRTSVTVSASTTELPSSFNRVLAAKIVTSATKIVSQTNYLVRQRDTLDELLNVNTTTKQIDDILKWNGNNWISSPPAISLPTQTGNPNKFLKTNGTTASWEDIPVSLPAQTGNPNKFLKTNGTTASWEDIPVSLPVQTNNNGKILKTNGTTASWENEKNQLSGIDNTYANALLISGPSRINDAAGDTWIFADSKGSDSNKYGIKHNQATNHIEFWGLNQPQTFIDLDNGRINLASTNSGGISFTPEPGGGGGDSATIKYYAISGEKTVLELKVTNDAAGASQDSINLVTPSGVGINTASPATELHVTGSILASGDITAFSDIKLKTNISTIDNALDIVKNIDGVRYTRIDTGENSMGVIANNVMKYLPELVQDRDGTLSVNYNGFSGLFIQCIKELINEVESLKQEIKKLKGE